METYLEVEAVPKSPPIIHLHVGGSEVQSIPSPTRVVQLLAQVIDDQRALGLPAEELFARLRSAYDSTAIRFIANEYRIMRMAMAPWWAEGGGQRESRE